MGDEAGEREAASVDAPAHIAEIPFGDAVHGEVAGGAFGIHHDHFVGMGRIIVFACLYVDAVDHVERAIVALEEVDLVEITVILGGCEIEVRNLAILLVEDHALEDSTLFFFDTLFGDEIMKVFTGCVAGVKFGVVFLRLESE